MIIENSGFAAFGIIEEGNDFFEQTDRMDGECRTREDQLLLFPG